MDIPKDPIELRVAYESLKHLREPALKVRKALLQEIENGADEFEGHWPDDSAITKMMDELLPPGKRRPGLSKDDEAKSHEVLTAQRSTSEYWRKHSLIVAESMNNLAKVLGADQDHWKTVGILHDLDFLVSPHFVEESTERDAHPMFLVSQLAEKMEFPRYATLAIMEHSPHLMVPPTSPLSHALILSDEHATLTGAGWKPNYPIGASVLSDALVDGNSITGKYRPDMEYRACRSLMALWGMLIRDESPQQFEASGWSPWP